MISLARLQGMLRDVLHLGDSPSRIALAFAVGAFIAFAPHYGFHTASVFLCAWAFRLNVVALLAGSLINNPWTILPILGGSMWVGLLMVPVGAPPEINWHEFTVRMLWEQLSPFAVPFVLGATLLGIVAALLGYVLVYIGIQRFRAHQARTKHLAPPPPSC